jgi:formylmethanofuran dehydrogenase subunit C
MTLRLALREEPRQRVDMSALIPRELAGRKLAEVAALLLPCGNRLARLDALFELSGEPIASPVSGEIAIENGSPRLDRIGAGMTTGSISVSGDAGAYAGFGMKGGSIIISGSAGVYAACAMEGGEIRIGGNAGDFLGAALPGERVGMRGGLVSVTGNAGGRAGDRMRRGVLLIAGDTGPYAGSRMVAGTIVVLGHAGDFTGLAMRRGTILLSRAPKRMLATFNDCGGHNLQFLWLLYDQARRFGSEFAVLNNIGERVRRFAGDRGVGGQGEILIAESKS